MVNKKIKKYIVSIFAFGVLFWLFSGVYQDTEFDESYWFIKHKPSVYWYFSIRPDDWDRYDSLSKKEQEKLDRYDEFVRNRLFSF